MLRFVVVHCFPTPSSFEIPPALYVSHHSHKTSQTNHDKFTHDHLNSPLSLSLFLYSQPFGYDGLVIDFVLRLQEATGFRCSSFKEFQDATGTGWNKFVHNVAACSDENGTIANNEHCQCDLGIGAWFENPARSHVAFLPPVAIDDMRMAVHLNQTTTSSSTIFFINAFHPYVWAATAALMICFTIVKLFDTRFVSVTPQYNPSPDRSCNATSILRQLKHKLLKGRVFFRTRRAIQSTCMFSSTHHIFFEVDASPISSTTFIFVTHIPVPMFSPCCFFLLTFPFFNLPRICSA